MQSNQIYPTYLLHKFKEKKKLTKFHGISDFRIISPENRSLEMSSKNINNYSGVVNDCMQIKDIQFRVTQRIFSIQENLSWDGQNIGIPQR